MMSDDRKEVVFEYSKPADKFLHKHEDVRTQFEADAKQVIHRIHTEQVNYKPLHGKLEGYFRIAIGSYRIIYRLINGEIIVVGVTHAGSRGDIYKKYRG